MAYRQVWEFLVLDFKHRCAYSMQHIQRAGGRRCMEVDHFNPKKKSHSIQEYTNLFLATRHCNSAKRNCWPTSKERNLGARFLNCCEEPDYGVHILEDPDTHEVVGLTKMGRYHVRNCDLNAPHLVAERAERAKLWRLLEIPATIEQYGPTVEKIRAIREIAEGMIPQIPYLSGEALQKHRRQKEAVASFTSGDACVVVLSGTVS